MLLSDKVCAPEHFRPYVSLVAKLTQTAPFQSQAYSVGVDAAGVFRIQQVGHVCVWKADKILQRTTQCKILDWQEGQKPALEITPNGGEIIARSVGLPAQSPPPFQHAKSKYAANIAITCRTRLLAAGALRSQDGFFVQDTMQWALWRGAHVRCFLCALRIIDRESLYPCRGRVYKR